MSKWPFEALQSSGLEEADMQQQALAFYHKIKCRRTVRDFSDKPVPRDIIENAIRAAGTSPSGANMQPWHYVYVDRHRLSR